jgi:hypothetical protein
MGLSLSKVTTDLKDYAKTNESEIVEFVAEIGLNGIEGTPVRALDDYVNIVPVDGPEDHVLTDIITVDPLQPGGTGTFNPKQYGTAGTRTIKTLPVKSDLIFTEDKILEYHKTYIFQASRKKFDPTKLPFEEWLVKKILTDTQKFLRTAFYKAVKTNPGANSTSLDIFNGILKHMEVDLAIDPTPINVVEVPEIGPTTILEVVDLMKKAIPSKFRYNGNTVLICGQGFFDTYTEAYRKEFGSLRYNTEYNKLTIDGSNIELAVEEGVEEFGLPIATVKGNFGMTLDQTRLGQLDFVNERSFNRGGARLFCWCELYSSGSYLGSGRS